VKKADLIGFKLDGPTSSENAAPQNAAKREAK
jgi:hypothetical protein